jgi:hypothetical protein
MEKRRGSALVVREEEEKRFTPPNDNNLGTIFECRAWTSSVKTWITKTML